MIFILTKYLLPILLMIGFIAMIFKTILHFKYCKIINGYPEELKFFQFLGKAKYIKAQVSIVLPLFFETDKSSISEAKRVRCLKLERSIRMCLFLFYLGFLTIPIGIKLQ